MQNVTLDSIGGGALVELFEAELVKVLANISDPNTDEKTKRSITMTVTFAPNAARDVADVAIACVSKLAGIQRVQTQLFMGRIDGKLAAVESNPKQTNLFDEEKPRLVAVTSGDFSQKGGA